MTTTDIPLDKLFNYFQIKPELLKTKHWHALIQNDDKRLLLVTVVYFNWQNSCRNMPSKSNEQKYWNLPDLILFVNSDKKRKKHKIKPFGCRSVSGYLVMSSLDK